jgi:hypothetical protein
MHFKITSTQNPKVKSLLALEKPRERRKQQLFVIEGEERDRDWHWKPAIRSATFSFVMRSSAKKK